MLGRPGNNLKSGIVCEHTALSCFFFSAHPLNFFSFFLFLTALSPI